MNFDLKVKNFFSTLTYKLFHFWVKSVLLSLLELSISADSWEWVMNERGKKLERLD